MFFTGQIEISTKGNCDIVDISERVDGIVSQVIENNEVTDAAVLLFAVGSTGALTTIEYEPGLVNHDIKAACEKFAPEKGRYEHEMTWHDDNGHAHVRATMMGPSLNVPVVDGKMMLGTWQQIVFIDFDTRARQRTVIVQVIN